MMDEQERSERKREEQRPVEEGGGGVSEGFEQAEQELIENAEHRDGSGDPLADRFTPEETDTGKHTAYGEADEIDSATDHDERD